MMSILRASFVMSLPSTPTKFRKNESFQKTNSDWSSRAKRGISQSKPGTHELVSVINEIVGDPPSRMTAYDCDVVDRVAYDFHGQPLDPIHRRSSFGRGAGAF